MSSSIEVRIGHRGRVRDGKSERDEAIEARCDLCGETTDAVASVTPEADGPFACKSCLRARLEAITVASWELREAADRGLPWGKFSG